MDQHQQKEASSRKFYVFLAALMALILANLRKGSVQLCDHHFCEPCSRTAALALGFQRPNLQDCFSLGDGRSCVFRLQSDRQCFQD